MSFNPRTRVGCDQAIEHKFDDELTFQSTHPRGVRPGAARAWKNFHNVSIHAPAWGATPRAMCRPWPRSSFNPRTRVGCDMRLMDERLYNIKFQSTHPRGVRQSVGRHRPVGQAVSIHAPGAGKMVSIHAPAWGATGRPVSTRRIPTSFNPRTRVGCDASLPLRRYV